ncbi:vestitone reductase [Rutidosis leptorrhynchoides]|uniref:vestitone reductase n=1 Tax=Rutidosis leptorrhynchoides TaxID=125765 RepID=UPI003A9A661B
MEGQKGIVCVTGGTGFLASWQIKILLQDGFSVHTTVRRDPENKRDLSFLTSLPRASENLKIFIADLSDPASFEPAIEGCTGVFHVATPMDFANKEPEEVITKRAVEGTLGILRSCLKFKSTVKRVVYTSSAAAVAYNRHQNDDVVMDESYWTDVEFVRSTQSSDVKSYNISKTLTEKAAFDFADQNGLDLVSLLPTFVVGPFVCPKVPASLGLMMAMILGNEELYPFLMTSPMVHVDDVARAQIFLLENPDVKGRYICSSHSLTIQEMAEFLSVRYPEYPVPKPDSLKEIKGPKLPSLSSKKLLEAGFNFKYGLEQMYDDAIASCKEKGYL